MKVSDVAKRVAAIGGVTLLGIVLWSIVAPKLGRGVNEKGLLALRPGMTEEEVMKLIGEPLEKRRRYGPHPIDQEPKWTGEWIWIYGEQGFFQFGPGFEISVGMKNGRLVAAGAERFDLGIWWCNLEACPVVWDKDQFETLPKN